MSGILARYLKKARFTFAFEHSSQPDHTWIPHDQSIEIAGRVIQGMVYVSEKKNRASLYHGFHNSVISLGLSVGKKKTSLPEEDVETQYLKYEWMIPAQRAIYLDWLAGSRAETDYNEAYIRFYFYGLEHRFFDSPSDEEGWRIINEVERLIKVYAGVNGFSHAMRVMADFLGAAYGLIQPPEKIQPRFLKGFLQVPSDIFLGLSYQYKRRKSLNADWILSWYVSHPRTNNLPLVAKRALPEFRALFGQLFPQKVRWKHHLQKFEFDESLKYDSGSGEFSVSIEIPFQGIKAIEIDYDTLYLVEGMVEDAISYIRRYSQFIAKDSMGRDSFEAYLLLPETIQSEFPIPAFETLKEWCLNIIDQHGGQTTIDEVLGQVFRVPSTRNNWKQLRDAEHVLSRISIGMLPFSYYELRNPRLGEPVFLMKLTEKISDQIMDSQDYLFAMISVNIASFIALSDGPLTEEEKEILDVLIQSELTNQAERERIQIYLDWLQLVPPTLPGCRKLIKELKEILYPRLRIAALCMISLDGGTNPVKMKALRGLYKALQLPIDSIDSDVHDVTTSGSIATIMSSLKASELASIQREVSKD